jgi:hypothetical protein
MTKAQIQAQMHGLTEAEQVMKAAELSVSGAVGTCTGCGHALQIESTVTLRVICGYCEGE